ncbi:MAG TPA: hypothetical protein VFU02_00850 [Polyangiaceae bacterium]|nr:hypothetical protein [Polyangiaceae bacterium]
MQGPRLKAPAGPSKTTGLRVSIAVVAAVTCLTACGGDGSGDADSGAGTDGTSEVTTSTGDGSQTAFLACATDTRFHLLGEVDGHAVDIGEAPSTGGLSQQSNPPGPHFRIPSATAEDDPQRIVVYLTWEEAVASGEVTPVRGWVRFPSDAPLAGQTICAGAGSEMTIPTRDDEDAIGDFQFHLVELSGGADCAEPLAGELEGCWRL